MDEFEFFHSIVKIPAKSNVTGESLQKLYETCLRATNIAPPSSPNENASPHNLLAGPNWLMVVPRRTAEYEGLSGNGLNFIGSFFVKNEDQYSRLQSLTPMSVLVQLGYPRPEKHKH